MDAYKDNAAGGEVCAEWAVVTISQYYNGLTSPRKVRS